MDHRIVFAAALATVLGGCGVEEAEDAAVEQPESAAVTAGADPGEGDTASADQPREMAVNTADARAQLIDSQGRQIGRATFTETNAGVLIRVEVSNLPEGTHGVHIHETGRCQSPGFESAGGHFNPDQRSHGFESAQGPHAGDLRNMAVGANGHGRAEFLTDRVTLARGERSLFGTDGSALVIHAQPDDYRTAPSGSAGDRIACGVIAAG